MRAISIQRDTAETKIRLTLNLDGTGKAEVRTGCGFLDHMLTLFSKHGRFDLNVSCAGDVQVDYHHTTEDIGIALGEAQRNRARAYGLLGDRQQEYRCLLEASPLLTAAYGPDHPRAAAARQRLAELKEELPE